VNEWLAKLPTTNLRILASIAAMIATTAKVIATGWMPASEWLWFLCGWAGIDVAQFATKRVTFKEPA
jgi:hypothetical protein